MQMEETYLDFRKETHRPGPKTTTYKIRLMLFNLVKTHKESQRKTK